MGLTHPLFFSFSVFLVAVIIFYFFRKRYEQQVVSSNLLWEQAMEEWQASPWFHSLQKNILLLLQLLILFILMLALVRPYWMVEGVRGEHIILIVDTSASMSATNGNETRFDEMKNELKKIINESDVHYFSLIESSGEPRLLVAQEESISKVNEAIDELGISYQYSDIKKASRFALSVANDEDPSIYVFSDSATEDDIKEIPETIPVIVHNFGQNNGNLSLKSFGTRAFEDKIRGIVVLENQGERDYKETLSIKNEDTVLYEEEFSIKPGEEKVIQIKELPQEPYYKASISGNDSFVVDNEMVFVQEPLLSKVYAVGDVNSFFLKGVESLGLEVVQIATMDQLKGDGIALIQGLPESKWPNQPLLVIAPHNEKEVELTAPITVTADSLLNYVKFENTYIQSASQQASPTLKTIAESEGIPLILKGSKNQRPVVVVNFNIEMTDWPLQPGFPIFLHQAVSYLSASQSFLGFFQPGEEKWINADDMEWKMFSEDGEYLDTFNPTKENMRAPKKPGIYRIVTPEHSMFFAVNLDSREKNSQLADSFQLHTSEIGEGQAVEREHRPYENLWYWLVLCGFIVLLVEWEVTRRGYRI